jgi:hypothetical protein
MSIGPIITDPAQKIFNTLAVEAREAKKQEMKIDSLFNLNKLDSKILDKFKIECGNYVYNKIKDKTQLQCSLLRIEFEDKKINYPVICYDYIIDPCIITDGKGSIFAMKINDYPKIKDHQIIADRGQERR